MISLSSSSPVGSPSIVEVGFGLREIVVEIGNETSTLIQLSSGVFRIDFRSDAVFFVSGFASFAQLGNENNDLNPYENSQSEEVEIVYVNHGGIKEE